MLPQQAPPHSCLPGAAPTAFSLLSAPVAKQTEDPKGFTSKSIFLGSIVSGEMDSKSLRGGLYG